MSNVVASCDACQTLLLSQQREEYPNDDQPSHPFESVFADYFNMVGKAFLVIADRLSTWLVFLSCWRDTTAAIIFTTLAGSSPVLELLYGSGTMEDPNS